MATINIGADNAADQFYRCAAARGLLAPREFIAKTAASAAPRRLCLLF